MSGWVTTVGSPTDKDRYKYGYDRNSNRQWRQNTVGSGQNLDEYYTYDNLNRLTVMQRGTLTGTPPTGISGTPTAEQDWTLDPTGNWNGFVTKASGSTTLNQSRTQNKVNEIATITASGGTPVWAAPAYDAAGNMTTMPKPSSLTNSYTATYDAWNRMIQVKDGGSTVATYRYDGRNRRVTVDTGVVRHFYFTNSWQDVEQRLGSLTTADQQYVWGIRYIDELVCRDRQVSGSSSSSSSSSSGASGLNERLYACQDANFNVTALIDTSATVVERYTYDPYGTPTFRNVNWTDIGASAKAITVLYGGYRYDLETGLYQARRRFLHSTMGVWLTRDPVGYFDGLNLYQYCRAMPTNVRDAFGLAYGNMNDNELIEAFRNIQAMLWDPETTPKRTIELHKELESLEAEINKRIPDTGKGKKGPSAGELEHFAGWCSQSISDFPSGPCRCHRYVILKSALGAK